MSFHFNGFGFIIINILTIQLACQNLTFIFMRIIYFCFQNKDLSLKNEMGLN